MRGDGTKLGITSNKPAALPPARLLDVTRLIRRAGRRPTGVDRVELAYLTHLWTRPEPLFAIARTTLGYVLLGPEGVKGLLARVTGETPWGGADTLSLLARRKGTDVRRAESDLRRLALARCVPQGLRGMLERHLPLGVAYLNIGHSNLTGRMMHALREGPQARIAVFLHDTIPLDYPQFQRDGTPEAFRAMLHRAASADLLIFNSEYSRNRTAAHMGRGMPPAIVAHLGLTPMRPDPARVPSDLPARRPYFVALGTIEPRKRIDLLLDVWQDMGRQAPGLLILGSRGWKNETVFDRLDRLPSGGPIQERADLSDAAIATLLQGSSGLLFPSEAEGFGLPLIEAASLGVPILCRDLPVYREFLRDIPVYLNETDRYLWRNSIESLAKGRLRAERAVSRSEFIPLTWESHFETVLSAT